MPEQKFLMPMRVQLKPKECYHQSLRNTPSDRIRPFGSSQMDRLEVGHAEHLRGWLPRMESRTRAIQLVEYTTRTVCRKDRTQKMRVLVLFPAAGHHEERSRTSGNPLRSVHANPRGAIRSRHHERSCGKTGTRDGSFETFLISRNKRPRYEYLALAVMGFYYVGEEPSGHDIKCSFCRKKVFYQHIAHNFYQPN